MTKDTHMLLASLNKQSGASDAVIAEGGRQLNLKLPEEYIEFLKLSNGGEGFIGKNSYVILWGVDELASLNQSYEVQQYAPGFLIFGSNGGGEAYGFDTRTATWPVVQIPFVGMDWTLAQPLGGSFNDFLETLYEVE